MIYKIERGDKIECIACRKTIEISERTFSVRPAGEIIRCPHCNFVEDVQTYLVFGRIAEETNKDVVAVIRCRDCKHGQQVGGYGVLCEYGLEELRPMDHFCAWGEVRSFEPEDNEEE